MTATLQETQPHDLDLVKSVVDVPLTIQLIDNSLARVEKLPEDDMDRQLANLILCAKSIHLTDSIRDDRINELIEAVPAVVDLIVKIHDTADNILSVETFDSDSSLVIVDLGVAADITRDKGILEQTLGALESTLDHNIGELKRALSIAIDSEDQMFVDVYRKVKAGKSVVAAASRPIPVSQLPDYPPNDELAQHLSKRNNSLPQTSAQAVKMSSYDDLFDGQVASVVKPQQTEFKLYEATLDPDWHSALRPVNK